ncbi:5-formyltetrahydrofolate cyclo-ligase-like [Clytia hemisphaerica]|uniref:5-formyltetrahydrofolate cyclo-ligase n=1 Tax=Clytia hemisphaerica TaxID=252671 RepID=A0A7M5X9L8_9CNID
MSATRSLQSAKQALRKDLKARLRKMTKEERINQSKTIFEKLTSTEVFKKSRTLSLYLSMSSEVHTNDILMHCFDTGKKCYIPHYTEDYMKMVFIKDKADYDSLPLTAWNIKQPADDDDQRLDIMDKGNLDLIIVPGLGFTRSGLRLGRGKGYYDNYFRKYEEKFGQKPYLIGLAYSCQMVEDLPADQFDIPLDQVLFP